MRSQITENHKHDVQGRPAGGSTHGRGFTIAWQDGPLVVDGERREPNGAFVEDIIAAAIGRIEVYQASQFACRESDDALMALRSAASRLDDRTKSRQARGVEGAHTV